MASKVPVTREARAGRRWEIGLALGNLLPAIVLVGGCYLLPLRWWGMDVPVALVVTLLLATSVVAVIKPPLALRALRLASLVLLVLGALLLGAFILCLAFVSGIHGAFGNLGAVLMTLVVLLIAPYAVAYPACELVLLHRLQQRAAERLSPSGEGNPDAALPESASDADLSQAEEA
ncbi:MAG: hypothetical protein ACOY0T_12295 [Myxococcota bacterium]